MKLLTYLHALARSARANDKGALLAEYGILAVGIAMAVAAAVVVFGGRVLALYDLPAPF
jgi:Flp pilus assembly pilin Flp